MDVQEIEELRIQSSAEALVERSRNAMRSRGEAAEAIIDWSEIQDEARDLFADMNAGAEPSEQQLEELSGLILQQIIDLI